jgi:hypothetical protein
VRLDDTWIEGVEEKNTDRNSLILQAVEADGNSLILTGTELPRLDSNQDKESQNLFFVCPP